MAIRDKNTLKTFFETGDMPSQNEFADLIDSFKHQNDTNALLLTDREIISIANRLEAIQNSYIHYSWSDMMDSLIKLDIAQKDEENQEIEMKPSIYEQNITRKQYIFGEGPYNIAIKEFKVEELGANEYYTIALGSTQESIQRLIGHKLPTTLEIFKFDVIERMDFPIGFEVSKQNFGTELSIVNTNIEFINTTDVPVEYRCNSNYWNDLYTTKNTLTSHYDIWDFLQFFYHADMTKEEYPIEIKVYDNDTKELLSTTLVLPGENHKGMYIGYFERLRNITIECVKK